MSDVHQTAGEVAGVSRTQRGINKSFTGAVGGDHVFRDRESLTKIGADRQVNDLPLRVRHQTAHAHQLTDLGHIAPSPRVGHHPDRVERIVFVEVLFDSINQTLVGLRPGVDHLGVTLNLCDHPEPVGLLGLRNQLFSLSEQIFLCSRNLQVVDRNRNGSLSGVLETQILQLIRHRRGNSCSVILKGPCNKFF